MRRKVDYHLILGYLLFSIGSISTSYSIIAIVLNLLLLGNFGVVILVKDVLFEIVFILLGLVLITKKKSKIIHPNQFK